MCELCGIDRKRGIERHKRIAVSLEKLAFGYNKLAYGTIKPHTDAIKPIESLARSIVRELVEDWV